MRREIKSVQSNNPSKSVIQTKYPAYKDSGEYWMGNIPDHWELKKLKHVFHEKKKVTNQSLNAGSISFGKVVYKDDEKIPESTKASYQELLAGEYLVNPLNLNYDLISLRIGLSDKNVVVSSGYIILKNSIKIDKVYYNYLLHRYDVAYMKLLGSGVRQTISYNHIANSLLAIPPISEQTAIARFLDEKTAKIDQAIAQKQQLIALLKERRQIMIQELVTGKKVWNGTIWAAPEKTKDSGIPWIGEIPEGWEVTRLKFISEVQTGLTLGKIYRSKLASIAYLRVANVQDGYFDLEEIATVEIPYSDISKYLLKKGDILVTEGGDIDKLGRGSLWESEIDPCIHQNHVFAIRISAEKTFAEYVTVLMGANYSRRYFIDTATKTTNLASTNSTKLGNLPIVLPTYVEQENIFEFIQEESSKIDQSISLQEQQIEKLREYKATMIDSAVTGKIKV